MEEWIAAGVAVAVGLVGGLVGSRLVDRWLSRPSKPDALRQASGVVGNFVFWLGLGAGLMTAVGILSPSTLEPIPDQIVAFLPRLIVAALFVIMGQIASNFAGLTVAEAVRRATGKPQPNIERVTGWAVMGAFTVLALAQMGIDNAVVYLLVGGLIAAFSVAFALLAGFGGQHVARNIAAGRVLRHHLEPGSIIAAGPTSGTIVELHPATVELERADGVIVHLGYDALLAHNLEIHSD